MSPTDKPRVWLHGEVRTPPMSAAARVEAGFLLRLLQRGDPIGLPASPPMPVIGPRCHELRVTDETVVWRIVYRVDDDAVVIAEVFAKKTHTTPRHVIEVAKARLERYDRDADTGGA